MNPFVLQPQSVHHDILERLCAMPKPVRGIAEAMLNRSFQNPRAIRDLAEAGLIRERGWAHGPGGVWIPTPAGKVALAALRAPAPDVG